MSDAATLPTPRALPAELSIYSAADTHAHMLRWLDAGAAAGRGGTWLLDPLDVGRGHHGCLRRISC